MLGSVYVHGLEADVNALMHDREDGPVEVNTWATELS